jgi:hypothetical protein
MASEMSVDLWGVILRNPLTVVFTGFGIIWGLMHGWV